LAVSQFMDEDSICRRFEPRENVTEKGHV
jgi:hypothetical protein